MNKQLVAVIVILVVLVGGGAAWYLSDSDNNEALDTSSVQQPNEESSTSSADTSSEENSATIPDNTDTTAITKEEVAAHNKESDCWTIISGKVYDITSYIPRHPGGDDILQACGVDGTSLFVSRETQSGDEVGSGEPHSPQASSQLERLYIGDLN